MITILYIKLQYRYDHELRVLKSGTLAVFMYAALLLLY